MILLLACALLLATSSAFASERINQPLIVEKNFKVGTNTNPVFSVNSTNGLTSISGENSEILDNVLTVSGSSTNYIDPTNGHLTLRSHTDGHKIFEVSSGNTILASDQITLNGPTTINDDVDILGDFAINTDKFTVASDTGNTEIGGTLHVTGSISADGGIELASSDLTLGGSLDVSGTTSLDHIVVMHDSRIFGRKDLAVMHTNEDETTDYVASASQQNILQIAIPDAANDMFSATIELAYHSTIYARGATALGAWTGEKILYGQQFFTKKYIIFKENGQDPFIFPLTDSHYQIEHYDVEPTLLTEVPEETTILAKGDDTTSYDAPSGLLTFKYVPCSAINASWPTAFATYLSTEGTSDSYFPYLEKQSFLYKIEVGTMAASDNSGLWIH